MVPPRTRVDGNSITHQRPFCSNNFERCSFCKNAFSLPPKGHCQGSKGSFWCDGWSCHLILWRPKSLLACQQSDKGPSQSSWLTVIAAKGLPVVEGAVAELMVTRKVSAEVSVYLYSLKHFVCLGQAVPGLWIVGSWPMGNWIVGSWGSIT